MRAGRVGAGGLGVARVEGGAGALVDILADTLAVLGKASLAVAGIGAGGVAAGRGGIHARVQALSTLVDLLAAGASGDVASRAGAGVRAVAVGTGRDARAVVEAGGSALVLVDTLIVAVLLVAGSAVASEGTVRVTAGGASAARVESHAVALIDIRAAFTSIASVAGAGERPSSIGTGALSRAHLIVLALVNIDTSAIRHGEAGQAGAGVGSDSVGAGAVGATG